MNNNAHHAKPIFAEMAQQTVSAINRHTLNELRFACAHTKLCIEAVLETVCRDPSKRGKEIMEVA